MTPEREQQRRDDTSRAPLMIGVLLAAELAGLTVEQIADPPVSFRLAASAQRTLNPFTASYAHDEAWLLSQADRVRQLAETVISHPARAWWWAAMDPTRQVWSRMGPHASEPAPGAVVRPGGSAETQRRISRWEDYAHRSAHAMRTSTVEVGGETSMAVATHMLAGDIPGPREEIGRFRMPVRRGARVFEIHGPADWHRLATTSGRVADLSRMGLQHVPSRTVPKWSRVLKDWDGVHLSLGGLLLSTEVSYETDRGLTRFWSWESEQTQWTSWVFDEPEALLNAFTRSDEQRTDDGGYVIEMPRDPAFGMCPGELALFRPSKPIEVRGDQQRQPVPVIAAGARRWV